MNRTELKTWVKEKIKGHRLELFITILVAGFLTNLTIWQGASFEDGMVQAKGGISLGIFFYFVEVGLAYYMVKFLNDKEYNFKDLFYFSKDYVRTLVTGLLEAIFVALWTLLLIVPGIIKGIAYSLVPLILADDKYKDLKYTEVLKKSEAMMKGHKMDFFVLQLSFIGWHILAIFTFFILEIWIIPYQTTANYKFLDDIMKNYKE